MSASHKTTSSSAAVNEASVMMSEPIMAAYKAYFVDLPLTIANEALRFAAHRLQEQAKLAMRLTSCKNVTEAAEAQSDFFRGAIGDYRKEAGTLVHRANDVVAQ